MSRFIIDFSFFQLTDNNIYIKELAITSLDGYRFEHYLLKPPFDFYNIVSRIDKLKIHYQQKEIGHNWNSGFVSYSQLPSIFKKLGTDLTIYVKGEVKKKLIEQILNDDRHKVKDLEGYGCPTIDSTTCKINEICPFGENHNCAKNKTIWLHMWWSEHSKFYDILEAVGNAMKKAKECYLNSPGHEILRYLPKYFITDHYGTYIPAKVYEDLPDYLQQDPEIKIYQSFPEDEEDWS